MRRYQLPRRLLDETFGYFRSCGRDDRECQVLWLGPWSDALKVSKAVHARHRSHAFGFEIESEWLSDFCLELASKKMGVRVQVHTHPGRAFHSGTDDKFPIVHVSGFLSLVVPNFGRGQVGFDDAYLVQLNERGKWKRIDPDEVIELV